MFQVLYIPVAGTLCIHGKTPVIILTGLVFFATTSLKKTHWFERLNTNFIITNYRYELRDGVLWVYLC